MLSNKFTSISLTAPWSYCIFRKVFATQTARFAKSPVPLKPTSHPIAFASTNHASLLPVFIAEASSDTTTLAQCLLSQTFYPALHRFCLCKKTVKRNAGFAFFSRRLSACSSCCRHGPPSAHTAPPAVYGSCLPHHQGACFLRKKSALLSSVLSRTSSYRRRL